jgi:hypothetical protein
VLIFTEYRRTQEYLVSGCDGDSYVCRSPLSFCAAEDVAEVAMPETAIMATGKKRKKRDVKRRNEKRDTVNCL